MSAKQGTKGVFIIRSPKGVLMISTISASRHTCKRRLLDPLEQKYPGFLDRNFEKWAIKGYEVCKARIVVIKRWRDRP